MKFELNPPVSPEVIIHPTLTLNTNGDLVLKLNDIGILLINNETGCVQFNDFTIGSSDYCNLKRMGARLTQCSSLNYVITIDRDNN